MEDEVRRRRDREERQRREVNKARPTDKTERDRDRKLVRA
jgi:hypothetical protein